MPTLEGTKALITGGSRGIGRAICLKLAARGAEIVLHYNRNLAAAEEVVAAIGREVRLVHANLGSPEEIQTMFRELSDLRLDFLINNAGVWRDTPLGSSPSEVRLVHANLGSPEEIQTMFRELSDLRLDFLINNAGVWRDTPLGSSPSQVIDEVLDTNVKGPFWVTQAVCPSR